jgi:sarcosine oxidase subunit delta
MRIPCPHCGERDGREFLYLGDASVCRPSPEAESAIAAFVDYVYFRDNRAGPHREYWYHAGGCQCWIVVTRNTRNHTVLDAQPPNPQRATGA